MKHYTISTLTRVCFQLQQYLHCHLQGHVWYCPWSHSETWHGWSPAFCVLSEPKDRQGDTQTSKKKDRGQREKVKKKEKRKERRKTDKSSREEQISWHLKLTGNRVVHCKYGRVSVIQIKGFPLNKLCSCLRYEIRNSAHEVANNLQQPPCNSKQKDNKKKPFKNEC